MYKRYKVVVTSNRCHLGRSPDICVNIIQNSLGAMSRGAEFHLSFLFRWWNIHKNSICRFWHLSI